MDYTNVTFTEDKLTEQRTLTNDILPEAARNYKDTVFRMLFREKSALLSLYNAVNKTNFTNVDDLEITTLENAVYMGMKNDVSCMFAFELSLYEHQSTVNPNMPLRDLFYVAQQLQKLILNDDLYKNKTVPIPTPRFAVFYNGNAKMPEQTEYRLSDLFQKKTECPELELIVTVYNINPGMNKDLLEACQLLKEYTLFTTKIRDKRRTMHLQTAVNQAVDECIREGILSDFLRKQRAEVIAMSIFEYDYERHMKIIKEEGREDGQDKMLLLLKHMEDNNEMYLISKLQDKEFLYEMYTKYNL
ncbi:MAG: hypothetical protein IJZ42_11595 [Lachnospiraceae bacterium]|nr:hypothetical protein [Lachnospiraceae bacterium]